MTLSPYLWDLFFNCVYILVCGLGISVCLWWNIKVESQINAVQSYIPCTFPQEDNSHTHSYQVLCNFNGIKLIYRSLCDVIFAFSSNFPAVIFPIILLIEYLFSDLKKKKLSESSREIKELIICNHASLFSWYFKFCLPGSCILILIQALHRCVAHNLSHTVVTVQITHRKLSALRADKTRPEIAGFCDRESLQLSKAAQVIQQKC